ncbi:MAG: insulinase family protein [Oscillospiraceae bacterium]|nr:insulinase family protein [Oscillospiraceae bacterium]
MFEKTGDRFRGFTVTRIRESKELNGRLVEMVYDKTGTELCWVDNKLDNKLFSIAFKTLPEESTGVFHILEHSVLCGSKKYPVREPFVELLKSSMNTFLNAMTFPDKTMYPVSSRNARDFLNLTEVYLDAVFAPAILENPNIFYQEGWHIETDENGRRSYKGVVFNEMKGAMSSVEDLAEYKIMEMLFPDNCYGCNSGGDPAVIPTLTYEKFIETYHRFYHPSNARIFLDGDIPIEETFALLEEYLSQFEKQDDLPEIAEQKPVSGEQTIEYELSKDEEITDKSCLFLGKIIGTWSERAKQLACSALADALAGTNDAPLKRAILSAGLAQEMYVQFEASVAQSYMQITFKNIADGREAEILPLLRETVNKILSDGLDTEALSAAVNRMEFIADEPDEPQGLDRCIRCMNSWLHGGDPMLYLVTKEDFAAVRGMIADGSIAALLRELFLDDSGLVILHAKPSYTRGEELRAEEEARLDAVCSQWSAEQEAENIRLNEKLRAWQQTPDSPEQLATLPVLDVSEVSPEPAWPETVVRESENVTVLYHAQPCGGIVNVGLYFRLTDCTAEELSLLTHIGSLCGKLPTAHYTALELQRELKNKVGRLDIFVDIAAEKNQEQTCIPMLTVRCSFLADRMADAAALIEEVLLTTDFTQKEKIRERILQTDERIKQMSITAGHALGMSIALSRYSAAYALRDAVSGYTAMQRTHRLAKNFDAEFEAFSALMQRVQRETCCKARLTAGLTAADERDISPILSVFPQGTPAPDAAHYEISLPERTGCRIPAQIGFSVQAYRLGGDDPAFDAGFRVAAKILSLSYLWNVVRVQGGAYGTGIHIRRDNTLFTFSFRDPTPANSLEVNRGLSDFIRAFCAGDEPLGGYIISTVNDEDPLRAPRDEGFAADGLWFTGRTKEEYAAERRQMLSTTRETLLRSCEVWDALAEKGAVCVCAAENQLEDCGELTVCEV